MPYRSYFTWMVLSIASLAAAGEVTVVAPQSRQQDAGYALASNDLVEALRQRGVHAAVAWLAEDAPLPPGDLVVVGRFAAVAVPGMPPAQAEGFRISPANMPGRRALTIDGDQRGLMYGLFKLAERVRLGEELWSLDGSFSPAFPLRLFSEQGQLLDIPDRGYYTDEPPYVDELRLRTEVDEAKRLVDHVVRLGYNTLAVLHLSFEEYIDYRYLDKPVYAEGDRHRIRSPVFCKYLAELCDYAHARHVDVHLQLYEIQYPPRLDELYGVDLDSPNIERIIQAKTRELFERVPLDGLVITATETHPRCGYRSKQLWQEHGCAGAGRMLLLYHNACQAAGKRAIFRLWRIAGDAAGAREVARQIPRDAMLSIKNTGGDFYLSAPTTDVITQNVGREQPLSVVFDTFGQFDGWSRLFLYMKRWGGTVRACRDGGVAGINAWGPWSPGCISPDWEPGYLTGPDGGPPKQPVSWVGHWSQFRMFTRGFTPGQANAYLLSRLAWEPDADVAAIARDFAALHVGKENAAAAAEALLATEDAFAEEYVQAAHPVYLKWTMVFGPRPEEMEKAYSANPLDVVLASNTRALEQVRRMEEAFRRTHPAKAADPDRYAAFREGIEKTALYLRTFYLWRQCWWRRRADQDLTGAAKEANAAAMKTDKARLTELFDQWQRWPEEAGHWRITFRYGKPEILARGVFPYWFPRGDDTMERTAADF